MADVEDEDVRYVEIAIDRPSSSRRIIRRIIRIISDCQCALAQKNESDQLGESLGSHNNCILHQGIIAGRPKE